jgi:predicted nuclease of predicted toxin-antitoxin system
LKVLLDACVWGAAKAELEAAGHEVVWAGDWPEDPGDDTILARAYEARCVLVTLDKDFGELAVLPQIPHAGIVRPVGVSAQAEANACLRVFEFHAAELLAGAIIAVTPGRLRIRAPKAPPT